MLVNNNISFKGPLDGVITSTLRTLDKNPMLNAVGLDLFTMVIPRTYNDTKERNEYAGAETFFREFTGTIIVCLSASWFAKGISKLANKFILPQHPINTRSWFSNDSINFLVEANKNTKNTSEYVRNIINSFEMKSNVKEFVNEERWNKYKWDNLNYENFYKNIKDKNSLIKGITDIIEDKNLSNKDKKRLLQILDVRMINLTQSDSATLKIGDKKLSASVANILRDMVDMGRDVFSQSKSEQKILINKLLKINKIKSGGALATASFLGLINQHINRKITEKRTGTKGYVGEVDYKNKVKNKESFNDNSKKLWFKKVLASLGMAVMAISVMRVKSPKDFMKKIEFTGPVTSGNAIKTVYASTLIGRFLASDNEGELSETVVRDYLGFLNWLVLGGFAAKGVANIMDPHRKHLFKGNINGKGIGNWLNNISLKSHNEIAVRGKNFAKKNMWKINVAQMSGLAYSTIVLGFLLPKLNVWMAQKRKEKEVLSQNA